MPWLNCWSKPKKIVKRGMSKVPPPMPNPPKNPPKIPKSICKNIVISQASLRLQT